MTELLLAADLGTTAIKALVLSGDGDVLSTSSRSFALQQRTSRHVEFAVADYWSAFVAAAQECTAAPSVERNAIAACSLSVQGETFLVVDAGGTPLMNAMSWLDSRASEEAKMLSAEFGDEECFRRTGQVSFSPTWPAAKLLWLKRNRPDLMRRAARVVLLEDYFLYLLTGSFACEPSLVCSTAYWDLLGKTWWTDVLEYIGIDAALLPDVHQSAEPLATLTSTAARELGLRSDVAVCVGGLDQACAAIGVGNTREGIVSENTGAALAICATVREPVFDEQRRMPLHAHAIPNTYMLHTFTSGGIVLQWFRDALCAEEKSAAERLGEDPYALLMQEAEQIPPGCEGLIMLPHLQGAMAPENNPDARGAFVGLTLNHQRGHFVRSMMEAIACAIRRNLEVITSLGIDVSEVRSTGGGARSDLWTQIKADITGRVTRRMEQSEAACLGAAVLAGVGVGVFETADQGAARVVRVAASQSPEPGRAGAYAEVYSRYNDVYAALTPVFPRLT